MTTDKHERVRTAVTSKNVITVMTVDGIRTGTAFNYVSFTEPTIDSLPVKALALKSTAFVKPA